MVKNYLVGSESDFHSFVASLSKKEKIGIVTHVDVDGVVSAIFLQKILESRGLKIKFIEFLQYSSDVLKSILKKDFDVLFFTDWNADNYSEDLENLKKKGKVLIIDHHPFNESLQNKKGVIKTASAYCSANVLFDLARDYFNTKEFQELACVAIIADYCFNDVEVMGFLESVYPGIAKGDIWSSEPGKKAILIGNALIFYRKKVSKVYELVLKNEVDKLKKANEIIEKEIEKWKAKFLKEAEYFSESHLYFYHGNPKYGIASTISSLVSQRDKLNNTIIFVSDIKEQKGFVKVSARNQSSKIDLGKVLKKCVEGFENASAGGHMKASAGSFPKKYLEEFKKRLINQLRDGSVS